MQNTDVIIVGAGPAGLALALALSNFQVKSVVLEKQHDICQDPRAIALAGDAARIVSLLGISEDEMSEISQRLSGINFHNGPFHVKPFLTVDHRPDWSKQAVPGTWGILQPGFERILRDRAEASDYITLHLDSEVIKVRQSPDHVEAVYATKGVHEERVVQGKYLVGADGKRGFVRKHHLEGRGVVQETGLYKYEATWLVANVRVSMPTPTSHPKFPLWELGYEPEELWDLFWPGGFHFSTHPTMPVATGRFGPANDTFWRFECELPPKFELPNNPDELLREQLEPHITLPPSRLRRGGKQPQAAVGFPWDCVEIVRCGPAHFAQKVVNRWYDGRVIVIGDAAHVFPPFGAQGIANGLRDAVGLSWRLSLLCDPESSKQDTYSSVALLDAWSRERRHGVDESTKLTADNGALMQTKSNLLPFVLRCFSSLLNLMPYFRDVFYLKQFSDAAGYLGVPGGYFAEKGGAKNAQVYTKNIDGTFQLSDRAIWSSGAALTLMLLNPPSEEDLFDLRKALVSLDLPARFLARKILSPSAGAETTIALHSQTGFQLSPLMHATIDDLRAAGHTPLRRYDPSGIKNRLDRETKYVLMRPDFIVFAQARHLTQLEDQLRQAWEVVAGA